VLLIGLLVFGMAIGALAQLVLGRGGQGIDWGMALVAGLVGSFVGGLLFSLIAGDGLSLRPSGIIGSIVGALIVTAVWEAVATRRKTTARAAAKKRARSGRHH
jgi:uncharacterized membrane protein YeaQ/YmgE (transglycosylase-associated protein family)